MDAHAPAGRRLTPEQVASWDGAPLVLFVGVTTEGSLAHRAFDGWAAELGERWALRGVDLPADTPPDTYRRLVAALRDNPAVRGAVVTAHKLRLFRACAAELASRDGAVRLTREVNALAAGGGRNRTVTGFARDPLSLTRTLPDLLRLAGADSVADLHVLCLGGGGAATALLLALHADPDRGWAARAETPARLVVADTDPRALHELAAVAARLGVDTGRLSLVPVAAPADCDALVARLPEGSLVVNATGLGKVVPGSPLTDRAPLGRAALAWDLNYRGPLTFLRQAAAHGTPTADGWEYFVAGWAGALTAVAGVPLTEELLRRFAGVARPHRPRSPATT
ncbi:hypothetical protein [Streptomyces mayteni]